MIPCYRAIYSAFRTINRRNFRMQGGASGHPWAQLSDHTAYERGRLGYPEYHPILQETGQLRDSLCVAGAKGAIFEPTVAGVHMGTDDPIADYHQDGDPERGLPAREIIDPTQADAQVYAEIVAEYFDGLGIKNPMVTEGAI
jgi:hypothetical protein